MSLGAALKTAYRTYVSRPSEILPFYLLGSAVPAVARTLPFVALLIGYWALARADRLAALETILMEVGPIPIDEPTEISLDGETTGDVVDLLAVPEVIIPLAGAVALAVVIVLVLNAAVSAGQLHGAFGAIQGKSGVTAAVDGTFRHASTFVGLLALEAVTYLVVLGVLSTIVGLTTMVAELLAVLVGIAGVMIGLVAIALTRLVFAFARAVAVVDDTGIRGALRGTIGYGIDHPGGLFGYGLLVVGVLGVTGAIASGTMTLGAGPIGTLVVLLISIPLLDLTKVALYGGKVLQFNPGPPPAISTTVARGVARGWVELIRFVRQRPGLVAISAIIFVGGGYSGWLASTVVDGVLTASIEQRLAETNVVADFLLYAGNNWQVAFAQAYAGLGLGVPAIASIAVNGVLLGVLFQLEVAPMTLLAFVIPHGLIEIPGLLVSGALGLYLGGRSWRYLRGQAGRGDLVLAIERAYRVIIGLAVVFIVAGGIEATISPYYWRLLGL